MKKIFLLFVLLICVNLMATDYIVSGAGSSEVNGIYTEAGTSGGYPYYTKDGRYFIENWDPWVILDDMSGMIYYYSFVSSSTPPSSGWETLDGYPSAPSVTPSGELPVELNSFMANISGGNVVLKWHTVTEKNNYGFDIERNRKPEGSVQNIGWEKIGFLQGYGNSNSPKEYTFTDACPFVENTKVKIQYRLKQIDTDGKYKYYSTIAEVNYNKTDAEGKRIPNDFSLVQNYPNPFNPVTVIRYQLPVDCYVTLKVYDILGNEVITLLDEVKKAGYYQKEFNGSFLSSGIYLYQLQAGKFNSIKKLILMK